MKSSSESTSLSPINFFNDETQGYVLARTFRGGKKEPMPGESDDAFKARCEATFAESVKRELGYLAHEPDYIFMNPTTLLSSQFPAKTIAHVPGIDWENQPSFLFGVSRQSNTSIADYGLASLNSFSSTDALSLLLQINAKSQMSGGSKSVQNESFYKKMTRLGSFLEENWHERIANLSTLTEQENAPNSDTGTTNTKGGEKQKKKFFKPFPLYFHRRKYYDELLYSLDELYQALVGADKLDRVINDVDFKPHPLAQFVVNNAVAHRNAQREIDETTTLQGKLAEAVRRYDQEKNDNPDAILRFRNTVSGLIFQASVLKQDEVNQSQLHEKSTNSSNLSASIKKAKTHHIQSLFNKDIILSEEEQHALDARRENLARELSIPDYDATWKEEEGLWDSPAKTYADYIDYMQHGLRHNELVSRVYPWEISGIEVGGQGFEQEANIALNTTITYREALAHQLREQGVEHPLFEDFMRNKISIDEPYLNYDQVCQVLTQKKQKELAELDQIVTEIITLLEQPIYLYQYSPVSRSMQALSGPIVKKDEELPILDPNHVAQSTMPSFVQYGFNFHHQPRADHDKTPKKEVRVDKKIK